MRRRTVSRQRDQIGPVVSRKVTPANHQPNKNLDFDPRQPPLPHPYPAFSMSQGIDPLDELRSDLAELKADRKADRAEIESLKDRIVEAENFILAERLK